RRASHEPARRRGSMSAAEPPQSANPAPTGGSEAAKPRASGDHASAVASGREADALSRFLARAADAREVRVARFERLGGGAIQDNYALDVDVRGGPRAGRDSL